MMNRRATTFIRLLGQATSTAKGYGRLYNWYAVSSANFAPTGWHLPTETEYDNLKTYLGGWEVAGGKLKEIGTTHWISPNTGATNLTGFTAFGSGYRRSNNGGFGNLTDQFMCWLAGTNKYAITLVYDSASAFIDLTSLENQGYSVRLVKDSTVLSEGDTSTMTDADGNTYNTVCINSLEWISQNWKCTHLNNGTSIPEVTDNTAWTELTTGACCYYNNDSGNL
jgi:uncharacterized protein (TIGR02145 family)